MRLSNNKNLETFLGPDSHRSARLMTRKIAHLGPSSWERYHRSPLASDDRYRIMRRAWDAWKERKH